MEDELVSNAKETFLMDEKAVDRFIQENRPAAVKLLDSIKVVIAKIKGLLTGYEAQSPEEKLLAADLEAFEMARDLWMKEILKAGENTSENSGERYVIKHDVNRVLFVEITEDILAGVKQSDWIKVVTEELKNRFRSPIRVGTKQIRIDGKSRRELPRSKYTQNLQRTDRQTYGDKFRSLRNTDEILQATQNFRNEVQSIRGKIR